MDLGLSDDIEESFRLFQGMIKDRYEAMVEEFGLTVIDATRSIEEQQDEVRALVERELQDVPKHPVGNLDFEED
jgi:dTMP kinase